jgi:CubicO group peptidase (beta-lactamase class C family)
MAREVSLSELTQPGALQERLERLFGNARHGSISLCLLHPDGEACAQTAGGGVFFPGCLTKLLTSALVAEAIESGFYRLESLLSEVLPRLGAPLPQDPEMIAGVTVKHLLEHTHGLDDSLLPWAPPLGEGRMDLAAVFRELSPRRLCPSGTQYNYSHAGVWILGALLEHGSNRSFVEILRDILRRELGVSLMVLPSGSDSSDPMRICPARGEALATTPADMLSFLRYQLEGSRSWCLGNTDPERQLREVVPIAGWSPFERGVRLGWKYYGAGWFGHNSEYRGTTAVIRVHPAHRIGFVVASTGASPTTVTAALMGKALPNLLAIQMPKLLGESEALQRDLAPYMGRYSNAILTLDVGRSAATLDLRAYVGSERNGDVRQVCTVRLVPARDDTFFPSPALPGFVPFVQFLQPSATAFGYLWNGNNILPRCGPSLS